MQGARRIIAQRSARAFSSARAAASRADAMPAARARRRAPGATTENVLNEESVGKEDLNEEPVGKEDQPRNSKRTSGPASKRPLRRSGRDENLRTTSPPLCGRSVLPSGEL